MQRSEPPRLVALLGIDGVGARERQRDELYAMWTAARAEANLAYDAWRDAPGHERRWAYLAAEERADAAQDALADICGRRRRDGDGFLAAA